MRPRLSGVSATIRATTPADIPAITAIYAHHVLHGLASFETEPPDAAEMTRRYEKVLADRLPHLVVCVGDAVVGFAYATIYRGRFAYRFTAEDSVYVRADQAGRGIGRALLTALVDECERIGVRQMVAVIGDSGNAPSIGLHAALGFEHAGTLKSVGYKFGRWLDTVRMQRTLGAGDSTPPVERG